MMVFDIETLGVESTAAILSFACTYFDPEKKPSPQQLRDDTFFIKLNVKDQCKRLGRTMDKGTLEWWSKQCDLARNKSFKPQPDDYIAEDALDKFKAWLEKYPKKEWVFARGNLDQCVFNSLEMACGREVIFPHYLWRDMRTAVDLLYLTKNGYCKVEYPGFDAENHIIKHDPVDDCVLDAMMLMYGKGPENE
jgi:hypothetical protein